MSPTIFDFNITSMGVAWRELPTGGLRPPHQLSERGEALDFGSRAGSIQTDTEVSFLRNTMMAFAGFGCEGQLLNSFCVQQLLSHY